ncbi:MAG: hypothetical protein A4E49_00744 [Methanosaeta sp. PtaU1.Bin112]|nr:MAG: hypothetical protein A4E49_00744 [Methanosaeta sp. PtaU1.Bin112]
MLATFASLNVRSSSTRNLPRATEDRCGSFQLIGFDSSCVSFNSLSYLKVGESQILPRIYISRI